MTDLTYQNLKWYVIEGFYCWKVLDSNHNVICNTALKEIANQISEDHNAMVDYRKINENLSVRSSKNVVPESRYRRMGVRTV